MLFLHCNVQVRSLKGFTKSTNIVPRIKVYGIDHAIHVSVDVSSWLSAAHVSLSIPNTCKWTSPHHHIITTERGCEHVSKLLPNVLILNALGSLTHRNWVKQTAWAFYRAVFVGVWALDFGTKSWQPRSPPDWFSVSQGGKGLVPRRIFTKDGLEESSNQGINIEGSTEEDNQDPSFQLSSDQWCAAYERYDMASKSRVCGPSCAIISLLGQPHV